MKKTVVLIVSFAFTYISNVHAQFTETNTELITNKEIVTPVLRASNEIRLANTFAANDPIIGTLDNTGYGINIHKTEGIGFAFNNIHRVFFKPDGSIRTSNSNPSIHIEGTGIGNYQGANLILSSKGVTSGNKHVSTWFMNHRGTDGVATIEMQRRGLNAEYNGSLLLYKDGYGWRFRVANTSTSGLTEGIMINQIGNVGIGTVSPTEKLQVQGTIKGQKLLLLDPNDTDNWNNLWESGFYQSYNATNAPEPNQWFWGINMNHSSNNSQYRYNGQIVIKNNSIHPRMYFRSTKVDGTGIWTRVVHSEGAQFINGSLGIGTTNPNGWKLAVNGKIRAKEIKVETNWADYVFEDEYNLPTLQEVEQHIQEKGHLKNIPSAKEVEKNGVELGEMNKLLLEKIEELTLYTIAQEKRIQALEKKLDNQ